MDNKSRIIKIIDSIPSPDIFDNDNKSINDKTKIIKLFQVKYNLKFGEIYKIYWLSIDIIERLIIEIEIYINEKNKI